MPKLEGPDGNAVKKAIRAAERTELPPTTTVKITRFLREYVVILAQWNESIDHAFRRLLGLPLEDKAKVKINGNPKTEPDEDAVKKALETAARPGMDQTITVKVSRFLREYVLAKAKKTESIDYTLRRLMGLPQEEKPEAAAS
jgi:hypothetical protein